MSAAAVSRREGLRTRVAAALVLLGLAALAAYALFSGPTTVRLPAQPRLRPSAPLRPSPARAERRAT